MCYSLNTVLHVSALIAPYSGRTLSYAQNYRYIVCLRILVLSDCSYTFYYTVRSQSRCALRLRYVDLVVSIGVFISAQRLSEHPVPYCCISFEQFVLNVLIVVD